MKKVTVFLFLFAICFVSASINVNNYTFKQTYLPFDNIEGRINLTIQDEPMNINFSSNQGGGVELGNVLKSYSGYNCTPKDCLASYSAVGDGSETKIFQVIGGKEYAGFLLYGDNVRVTGLNFSLSSDFSLSTAMPLKIKFFEDGDWEFDSFSENYSEKNWGCFSEGSKTIGPLIRTSTYCEEMNLSRTNAFFVGALTDKADTRDLKMMVYDRYGSLVDDCAFNPISAEGCQIKSSDVFESGTYKVCVGAVSPTNYRLYEESVGKNCGFVYSQSEYVKDYGIFARTALYSSGQKVNVDMTDVVRMANDFIEAKYGSDCSFGCVLPLEISGISQNLQFSNIAFDYVKNGEDYLENKIYSVEVVPARVNFRGVIDLAKIGLNATEEGDYILYLGEKKLFSEEIDFLPAPILLSVSPVNPPAGIPVVFYLGVDYNDSIGSVSYKWIFGDGKIEVTKDNFVMHTFNDIKNYTIVVEASAWNITVKKNFTINVISPKNAINGSIAEKKNMLNKLSNVLNTLPAFYAVPLKEKVNFSYYQNLIKKFETENANATTSSDYLKIAKELYSVNFIKDVYITDLNFPILMTNTDEIVPSAVAGVSGENLSDVEQYKDEILSWQNENIGADVTQRKVGVSMEDGTRGVSLVYYNIKLNQNSDEESYFVVVKPSNEVFFNNLNEISSSDSSVIPFNGGQKTIEFYYFGVDDASIFVSPKLSTLVSEESIIRKCNYNKICEDGEDYKTCRSDCKPRSLALIYVIIAFIIFIIIYTWLQIWYKNRYESYLFGNDKHQIYNLLMFVANARTMGMKDGEIMETLRKKGWNLEKISYIIKKSYGRRTGMFEIIPTSRIAAYLRKRKAKNQINSNAVPPAPSFNRFGNINK